MKKITSIIIKICSIGVVLTVAVYVGLGFLLQFIIDSGAKKLITLEKQGKLSRTYGYVWQEINANMQMKSTANAIVSGVGAGTETRHDDKPAQYDFPSLEAVAALNNLKTIHKTVRVNDRNGILLILLRTTHTSMGISDLNEVLLKSLLATEDKHFYTRKRAYDYHALLRATVKAVMMSLRTLKLHYPRGSSTIHMQVARFLLMRYDKRGYAYAEQSISRKVKELKLAEALRMRYSNDELLTLYINHCVSAGRGMLGFHDISMGLFGVTPDKLTIPQSLYLARLVKWNRQVPQKIINQIKSSLPALAKLFDWSENKQLAIKESLDTLTFKRPVPLIPSNSYLLDLANEYWRKICKRNGMDDDELAEMDIADPESMIRQYGNLTINLTIDYRLQKLLERVVSTRGFGPDTTIRTDISIGSYGVNISSKSEPADTIRKTWVVTSDTLFSASSSTAPVYLTKGDTVVINIRYKKSGKDTIRRSVFYYKRDTLRVPGQYYAYAMMDSRTSQLLAYCSKDRLGSRLRSLMVNKNPNGSSVAKPLIYALSYDMGVYKPADMASDNQEIADTCAWARTLMYKNDSPVGMVYLHVPEKNGYQVQNYNKRFDGHDFIYNHLSRSNNILAVETMYRLSTDLESTTEQAKEVKKLLKRLKRSDLESLKYITGPQIFSTLVSASRDTAIEMNRIAQNYSIALGTLESSLYEQMHLFNILYNNTVVLKPSQHPSLFVKSVKLAGGDVSFSDTLETCTVFSSIEEIKPVHLALHKRLLSNPADRLSRFDFCDQGNENLSNFAKSGTTDDIIRPFNTDVTDTTRANYGLWNAVLRLRLTRNDMRKAVEQDTLVRKYPDVPIPYDSVPLDEILDVTLASIGECNTHYTGERDGKTLHGYVSRELLHAFGVPCSSGFYTAYETGLGRRTSDRTKYATAEESNLPLLSRALIRLQTGIASGGSIDDVRFEQSRFDSGIRLRGKNYRKMLKFASYMGSSSRYYHDLVEQLKKPDDVKQAREIIKKINEIQIANQVLKRDVERACVSLLQSLETVSID